MVDDNKEIVQSNKGEFSLLEFRIIEAELKLERGGGEYNLYVNFIPSGVYRSSEGIFELTFETLVTKDTEYKNVVVRAKTIGDFKFAHAHKFEEIPAYFF